jgi:hypothetical protein
MDRESISLARNTGRLFFYFLLLSFNKSTMTSSPQDDLFLAHCSTTVASNGAGTGHPSTAPEFKPFISRVLVSQSSVICVMLCRSLLVHLSFIYLAIVFGDILIVYKGTAGFIVK